MAYSCGSEPRSPAEVAAKVDAGVRSPQSTVTIQGESEPGSANRPSAKLAVVASVAGWSDAAVTAGAMSATPTWNLAEPVAWPSSTLTVTGYVPYFA